MVGPDDDLVMTVISEQGIERADDAARQRSRRRRRRAALVVMAVVVTLVVVGVSLAGRYQPLRLGGVTIYGYAERSSIEIAPLSADSDEPAESEWVTFEPFMLRGGDERFVRLTYRFIECSPAALSEQTPPSWRSQHVVFEFATLNRSAELTLLSQLELGGIEQCADGSD